MASLSHAPFATPNTQQLSPSHKLLPSHLSMDPASSSLSTLTQPFSSEELTSWLQKPNAKLSYNHLNTMSSFNHPYPISSPLYEGYSEAVDSVEQGFIGGDDPLLTSSWDALDKLVSASMTSSGSGIANELPEFAYSSAQGSTLQRTSPSSMTAVEQKPFNVLNGSNYNQKGGVCNMWGNHQASTNNSSTVGLNLASLISADPGFVERAAKFSSYSQQAYTNSLNQSANNIISINNALSLENFNLDCVRKLSGMNAAKASCINGPVVHRGDNVAMDLDANSDISAPKSSTLSTPTTMETKQSISPQRSMANISGSKKKREGAAKDGELDDAGGSVGRKKAKGGEKLLDEDDKSNVRNVSKVGRGDPKTKMQQSGESNSVESEQKSGGGKEIISKPNGTNTTTTNNGLSSSQAPKPDFIHVRARRGQATDSHSLAERVRREKISERMKYLQDLVPGCTKVTGKAMMLDEIINYVQSLQRQVEFLSMKLAAVHPSKLEFNFESLFGKEVVQQPIVQNNQSVSYAPETHANLKSYPLLHENLQQLQSQHHAFPESNPPSCMHSYGSDAALRRTLSMLAAASSDMFGDQCISSQITDSWDEDLQNIVQLGFPQTPLNVNPNLQGALLQGQMKTEL